MQFTMIYWLNLFVTMLCMKSMSISKYLTCPPNYWHCQPILDFLTCYQFTFLRFGFIMKVRKWCRKTFQALLQVTMPLENVGIPLFKLQVCVLVGRRTLPPNHCLLSQLFVHSGLRLRSCCELSNNSSFKSSILEDGLKILSWLPKHHHAFGILAENASMILSSRIWHKN
jgi:hypothetical protein